MSRPNELERRVLRDVGLDPDNLPMGAEPLAGRVDLTKAIEDGVEPPEEFEPGILLKGRVHSVYAAGGTGKSWFSLWLIKRAVERGAKVVLLDAENGHRIVSERLAALGIDTSRLSALLLYYPFPNLTLDPEHVAAYRALLDREKPDLVVFDSLVNFLGSAGLEENSNDDIVKWATRYARPAREREITTVILDHVPHDGNHARGASRKRDEVDVMWELKNPLPFDRDTVGRVVLRREKDREGWLGERAGFSVGGTVGGFVFRQSEGTIEEPDATDGLTTSARKALDILRADFRDTGATAGQWHKATKQAASTFYRSRDALLRAGVAEKRNKRYFPKPTRGGGSIESEENPTDTPDVGSLPLLPKHSHGSNGSGAGVTPITPTTLKGGSNGSTAGGGRDIASDAPGDTPPKGTEDKGVGDVATRPANPSLADGGSSPGSRRGGGGVVGRNGAPRRLTVEEAERVKRLVAEGMSPDFARAEVLAKNHPLDCECGVCA